MPPARTRHPTRAQAVPGRVPRVVPRAGHVHARARAGAQLRLAARRRPVGRRVRRVWRHGGDDGRVVPRLELHRGGTPRLCALAPRLLPHTHARPPGCRCTRHARNAYERPRTNA
eukprot:6013877-Prymnesium_polylepis.1